MLKLSAKMILIAHMWFNIFQTYSQNCSFSNLFNKLLSKDLGTNALFFSERGTIFQSEYF